MRTIIDIPDKHLIPLDAVCAAEGVSRAEMIRQGIEMIVAAKQKARKKITLEDAFGICVGKDDFDGLDGLEYQRKIRAEWDDHEKMIDDWIMADKGHLDELITSFKARPAK